MAIIKKQYFTPKNSIPRKELEKMGYRFKVNLCGPIITEYIIKSN